MEHYPDVSVYSRGILIGELAEYTELSFSYVWRGSSSASFQMPGVPEILAALPNPAGAWIDIVIDGPKPWTGRITDTTVVVDGQRGVRTEITAVQSKAVLSGLRVYPDPAAGLSNQSAQEAFTITAPARTAVERLISDAADRQRVPIVVAEAAAGASLGSIVSVTARMDPVLEVVEKFLAEQAMGLVARTMYPGVEPLTDRVSEVSPGTVVVDLVEPVFNDRVMWRESDLTSGQLSITHATAAHLIVGGDGTGKDRTYLELSDEAVADEMAPWGGLQSYVDAASQNTNAAGGAVQAPSDPLTDARTTAAWANIAGSTSVAMSAPDGQPYIFGEDYQVGDIVSGEIAGVEAQAQVTEVEIKVTPNDFTVTPKIGDATASPLSDLVSQVANLAREDARAKRWK